MIFIEFGDFARRVEAGWQEETCLVWKACVGVHADFESSGQRNGSSRHGNEDSE